MQLKSKDESHSWLTVFGRNSRGKIVEAKIEVDDWLLPQLANQISTVAKERLKRANNLVTDIKQAVNFQI